MVREQTLPGRLIFQEVVRAGGFSAASPRLDGRDASVTRRHLRALEHELGVALFHRRPFRLTAAGRTLYEYDRPLLAKLRQVTEHLQRKASPRLTAGVAHSAAKRFLFAPVRQWMDRPDRHPIHCRFGSLRELRPGLETGELDLLITAVQGPPPGGFASRILAVFPPVLLVPVADPIRSAEELWSRDRSALPLVTPDADDPVTLTFVAGLARGKLTWPARLTCDSPASMVQLVASGLGYGLTLSAVPCGADRPPSCALRRPPSDVKTSDRAGIRELPLLGIDAVPIVALWRPEDSSRLKEPLRLLGLRPPP